MSAPTTGLARFDHTFARDVPELVLAWTAAEFPAPALLVLNEDLAEELGLDPVALRRPDGVGLLVGAGVSDTAAMVYAGHQFGGWSPRLGDGRALLLGELVDRTGLRRDVHLKGSGRTPFSRGGDGFAAVGPMLREHLIGEAMHALGVPTTRALAVLATGAPVAREAMLPGAVLVRVAASHIRVGTFSYVTASGDTRVLRALADHVIARHHPDAAAADQPYLELYRRVVAAQADLVARWMGLGFVHGVMNTDNMTLSGETIDYGPCAFLDAHDPNTVFSSIDTGGRYAYGNQPAAAQWDLARLGEALLPLLDEHQDVAVQRATEVIDGFASAYRSAWVRVLAAKLGLPDPGADPDGEVAGLAEDLLALLTAEQVDHTNAFRALADGTARDLFLDRPAFDAWAARWSARRPDLAAMNRVNPAYIPRNHLVQAALDAATEGELGPYRELLDVVVRPFDVRPGLERFAASGSGPFVTYCGT